MQLHVQCMGCILLCCLEKKILFTLTLTADFLIFKFLKNLIYLNVSENGHHSICLCKTPVPFRSARGPTQTHIIFLIWWWKSTQVWKGGERTFPVRCYVYANSVSFELVVILSYWDPRLVSRGKWCFVINCITKSQ